MKYRIIVCALLILVTQQQGRIIIPSGDAVDLYSNGTYDTLKMPCDPNNPPGYTIRGLPSTWLFKDCKIHIPKSQRIAQNQTKGRPSFVTFTSEGGYFPKQSTRLLIRYKRKDYTNDQGQVIKNKIYIAVSSSSGNEIDLGDKQKLPSIQELQNCNYNQIGLQQLPKAITEEIPDNQTLLDISNLTLLQQIPQISRITNEIPIIISIPNIDSLIVPKDEIIPKNQTCLSCCSQTFIPAMTPCGGRRYYQNMQKSSYQNREASQQTTISVEVKQSGTYKPRSGCKECKQPQGYFNPTDNLGYQIRGSYKKDVNSRPSIISSYDPINRNKPIAYDSFDP